MLAEYFGSPSRIQEIRAHQGGRLLEGFAQMLYDLGYAQVTARRHLRSAEHLVHWTGRRGIPVTGLEEQFIGEFSHHLNRCRCTGYGRSHRLELENGVRLFIGYLRSTGVLATPIKEESVEEPALLVSFGRSMRQQRGTCDATLYNYGLDLRDLLKHGGEDPAAFHAQMLRNFVLEKTQQCGWAAAKRCITAVRAFLRFLIADGRCAAGLDAAIPALAHWRLSTLPRYLQPEDVERVIASCDSTTQVGRRDRAILLLLARMGLRAGDIFRLRPGDIDWKEASIRVAGKGRRQASLPLTQEIGDAIIAYIKDGRPKTDSDALFIRSRAPFRAFASHCAISMIVIEAMRRAGVTCPSRGAAHVLRHSVASSMLRQGASLQEIAGVLRHRSIATTEIYAKIDVVALRQIAQPWPEVEPC
jgi:integrase/recombinase XerD